MPHTPDIAAAQEFLCNNKIDGWLLYDFRQSNPMLARLLPGKRWTTRRAWLYVPVRGEPTLLAHSIDSLQFGGAFVQPQVYLSWPQMTQMLASLLAGARRVAMDYAPGGALPAMSVVDAGTVEMIRGIGVDVVSSADLAQACVARWSDAAQKNHALASKHVTAAKDSAFDLIRQSLASGRAVNEYQVQQHIVQHFAENGLEFPEPPIVAANAHGGDPHFEVSEKNPTTIKKGDWILIDLWARVPGDENIFSDITWVGCCGQPSERQIEVYNVVKASRDACVKRAVEAWNSKQFVQGWQLDDAARTPIINAGYTDAIKHRTGHSLSPGPKVHGLGMNVDNLETHDTREMLPGIGFTVEPGIYLADFGVRLEINVFVDPEEGPTITSCIQDEIIRMA